MKSKYILLTILSIFFLLITTSILLAQTNPDFKINTHTQIYYTTGKNYVTVVNEYQRLVENNSYYFTKEGEKVFHIPDVDTDEENVKKERAFKLDTLKVTDTRNNPVHFTTEEKGIGEGIYIHIPYYRTTTKSLPYKILMTYDTHDNVIKSGNLITIVASSLPIDTLFIRNDEKSKTTTEFNYDLSIISDKNIPTLAKAYPSFIKEEKDEKIYYNFKAEDRIGKSPTLEFGTSAIYRFELEYETPKTDNLIPSQYSEIFKALSTNIYEISLPREFSETDQKIDIDEITPTPRKIYRDSEGNVIASFELAANKEDRIKVTGYISSSQDAYDIVTKNPMDITFSEYLEKIRNDKGSSKYLTPTKYWEVQDPFIQQKASELKEEKETLHDVVDAVYQYVNDTLTYDEVKASSENERIGAVKALTGGASVCMEYADSMIAILRAQGIPARAALGYANITDTPVELIRHQWLQIWIPDYGWLSIDPTFESPNRKMGQLIERVLWETFYDDSLSNISIFSANKLGNFSEEKFSIKIYSVEETPPEKELKRYSDILDIENSNRYTVGNFTNSLFKTTVLGKALLVTLPIIVTIALLIFFIVIIKLGIKKVKKKKEPEKERTLTNRSVGRFTT